MINTYKIKTPNYRGTKMKNTEKTFFLSMVHHLEDAADMMSIAAKKIEDMRGDKIYCFLMRQKISRIRELVQEIKKMID
jgi:uncharacterized protein (DUF305 family)